MSALGLSPLSRREGWLLPLAALPFTLLSVAWGGLCLLGTANRLAAADPGSGVTTGSPPSANRYVTQALEAEANGDLVGRDRLLTLAAKTDSNCDMAQWQRGFLKSSADRWQTIDESMVLGSESATLDAYEARRLTTSDNAAGQWQLALWCLQNRLPDQTRAHAWRTIELVPSHEAARRLLGYQFISGEWVSVTEWKEFERRASDVRQGLEKYGKPLSRIARALATRNEEVRDRAREKLMSIREPIAIAPVEGIIGAASPEAAVDWLGQILDPEASRAIARFALFHPDAEARQAAIVQLKERPYHDYVPDVLQMLSAPVASMAVPTIGNDGVLRGFRQTFTQEHQGQTDVFVLDTRINYQGGTPRNNTVSRSAAAAPFNALTQAEALARANVQAIENQEALQVSNERILARNRQIAHVLSQVADREFSGAPSELWKWWDETNETEYQSLKLANVRYGSAGLSARNYTALAALALGGPSYASECFARGTPVVTRRGARPIESIRVGDLVLSRDIPTGELSWKPVVRTTVRPPRPTFEISLDDQTMRCTGGHLFWVSGKGWTKASQLQAGDVLHGAASPAVVMKTKQRPEETTYNLAVEGTQTYFVGAQMVLSHDVTDRVPTYIKVPGLPPLAAQ